MVLIVRNEGLGRRRDSARRQDRMIVQQTRTGSTENRLSVSSGLNFIHNNFDCSFEKDRLILNI